MSSGRRGSAGRLSYLLPLAFLLIFIFPLQAGDIDASPLFMWNVSHGNARIFLLGSIHVLTPDFYPLPPVIEEVLKKTDLLVLEAHPNPDPDDFSMISTLTVELGFYHDGTTLKDHIPSPVFELLLDSASVYGLFPEQLEFMRPWLIALTLGVLELRISGFLPEYGMETAVLSSFSGPVYELEGAEFQIRLMAGLSDSDQLMLLEDTLEELDGMAAEVNSYVRAWKNGSTETLEKLLRAGTSSTDMEDQLIHRRNLSMTDKIEILLNEYSGTVLILAGALHFVGDTGIPELLTLKGFTVQQVMSDGSLIPIPE